MGWRFECTVQNLSPTSMGGVELAQKVRILLAVFCGDSLQRQIDFFALHALDRVQIERLISDFLCSGCQRVQLRIVCFLELYYLLDYAASLRCQFLS